MVWPWLFCGTVFVCSCSLLTATTTWCSIFCLLSFVTRFACDTGQSAKVWICVLYEAITVCIILVNDWSTSRLLLIFSCYTMLARPKNVETAACPWPQFLAFCLRSKYIVIILLGFLGSNQCWIIVKDKKNNNTKFQLDQDRGSLLKSSLTDSMFLPVGISIALSSPNVLTLSRKERCRRRGPKPTTIACIKDNNFSSIIAVNVPSSC